MSNIEDIIDTQQQLRGGIEQLLRNFKKDGAERKTPTYIKKRLETLETYWTEFQTNHTELYNYEDHNYTYFSENHYQRTQDTYNEARRLFSAAAESTVENPRKRDKSPQPLQHLGEPSASEKQQQQQQPTQTSTNKQTISQGNASKTDEMLRKQKSNFKAFTRTIDTIKVETISEKWEFEDTLKTLEARWKVIDTLHWEIDSEATINTTEYEQNYEIYERRYIDLKKSINSKMWSISHKEHSTPKMELPTFTGSYINWTSFKDLFTETVHSNPTLSSAQKMQFLKAKLKGEAEKLIQHLTISSENYEICWEILNHRYNNKKLIFTSHLNAILNLPTIQQQTSTTIKKVHDTANECINAIQKLGVDISTWDPILVHLLSQKLDSDTFNDYSESLTKPRELPSLAEFLRYLENKFLTLEISRRKHLTSSNDQQQQQRSSSNNKFQHSYKAFSANQDKTNKTCNLNNSNSTWNKAHSVPSNVRCPLCKNQHGLFHCNDFLKLQLQERRSIIAKHNLCKNCLFDHKGKQCIATKRCRECNGPHHTLLHDTSGPTTSKSSNVSWEGISETLLATALVKVTTNDGSQVTLRALIDQGSQISLITENAAQILELPRQKFKGVVFGVGAQENICKGAMDISCTSMNNNYTFKTRVYVIRNLMNKLPSRTFQKPSSWDYLKGIQLADPEFNLSRPVDILLGADIYSNIILGGIIKGQVTQPIAQQTQLGWILCGNMTTSYQCNVVLNNLDDISRFWEVEDVTQGTDMSTEDLYCLQQYQNETKRNEDGRYVVRLPLHKDIDEKLGESKSKATAQFYQQERKFEKVKTLATKYKQFMSEYAELEHMKLSQCNETPSYYLPHHSVQRADSTTTPLRVIFNASAKTSSGLSLNDLMFSGPNLQTDLFSLILKLRMYKVAFTGDISKMFRQIFCHEDDQKYQKILWRDNCNQPLRDYALVTVTYGLKASPFLAMMTLKQLANDERHNYPEAAAILESSFYMDDLLYSAPDLKTAARIKNDLTNLLKAGGFTLRKWSSNKLELLETQPNDQQETFDFKHQESTKTLGLRWSPIEDNFNFQLPIETNLKTKVTKRFLLSEISKIFDPLGWLSPVTTKLKLIFQRVWLLDLRWDDEIPEDVYNEWEKIKTELHEIDELQIPRWLQIDMRDDLELHGFCDSSQNAYACVIYCKNKKTNTVVILAAKSRLVPAKKTISLPRLELCAAQLLANLMQKVLENFINKHNITLFAWSDSTAVLGWLQGDPSRWKPFVCNRVQKITQVIPAKCWRYVKSSDNSADCASRGISPSQLKPHQLWWKGPEWLPNYLPSEEHQSYETNEELKKLQSNATVQEPDNSYDVVNTLLTRNSCLNRVTRVIAWILRAGTRDVTRPEHLTPTEIRKARDIIIKYIQLTSFEGEIKNLKQNKEIDPKSKLLPLNPYLDEEGLLRVKGRINNANIDADQKNPIIVPHEGRFTELLIDQAHQLTFHGGARLTSANIRKHYWIIGGNRAVKRHIHNCIKCRRQNPIKQSQLMGDLPAPRCNPTRPFYHTGVDYTGFVEVKANKGRGIKTTKGYIAVFVCMVTKAAHLELVSDLSSSAFLSALRRLAARRGAPRHIYSDNGTNFHGANNTLTKEYFNLKNTLDPEFFTSITDMNIDWHFNAPSWPSAGGLWESCVKSLKYHLKRVLGEQKLTFEELSTLLAQLEACLNSRPLLPLTEDPDDIDYLTPSHFLSSGPNLTLIETETDERTRWQLVQKIFKDVWKRWQSEYLTQISSRSKWRRPKENMKLNDVVVIHDANLPAGKWALGRVVELHPGKDGYVRVASVRTKHGILKRPITKLSILPVSKEEDEKENNEEKSEKISEPRKQRKCKRLCNFITTMLWIISLISPARCNYSLTNINNNQSIYFDKVTDMHLVRDEWKLIVYYDMNPYWQGIHTYNNYFMALNETCSESEKHPQCEVVLLQLQHGLTELSYYNSMLLGNKFTERRRRRGLIDGVGYIANSLFGVLDERYAEKYEKEIDALKENDKHLAQLWRNQTSIVEAENNIMKRVEATIYNQYKQYKQHLNNLAKATNTLATEITLIKTKNDFIMLSIIANNILVSLRNIQETLLETVTEIHYGKFNIHLLSPQQLTEELNVISGQLAKDLTLPIDNIHLHLRKLYHLLRVKAIMMKKYFIFEIKIPLVTRDSYEIFKLISVPQKFRESMATIEPISSHIAINLQKDAYIPMSKNELQLCTPFNDATLMCTLQRPIYNLKSDDKLCKINQEISKCEITHTKCNDVWTELNNVNTFLYFSCGELAIRILCGHQIAVERVTKAGIISIGEGCVIKTDSLTIYSHMQQSNSITVQPAVLKINIPPINNIFNLTLTDNSLSTDANDAELQEYSIQLDKLGKQMQELNNGSDDLPSDRILSQHDIHQFAVIYLLAGTALFAIGLYLWRRVRARCSIPIRASHDHHLHSEPDIQLRQLPTKHQNEPANDNVGPSSSAQPCSRSDKATSPRCHVNKLFLSDSEL